MISGSVKGAGKLMKQLNNAAKTMEKNRDMAVKEATLRLHQEAIVIVSENKGGSIQKRYKPKRFVMASKPNTPPHTDRGELRKSIKFNYKNGIGQVGSNLKYAAWLEFGTSDMEPRPWLSVAVKNVAQDVADIFKKWFDAAIKEIL